MNIVKLSFIFIASMLMLCAKNTAVFGLIIGQSEKTIAYSNLDESHVTNESHFISIGGQTLCTGMKWQCVEYVRRWLMENKDISFSDVEYATDIWKLSRGLSLVNHKKIIATHYANGQSFEKPQYGDLLIYDTSYSPGTGHVSVIVEVEGAAIKIAEQNHLNQKWIAPDYAQKFHLVTKTNAQNDTTYRIDKKGIIGWIRFAEFKS